MGAASRTRHLIFLAHIWICAPFALLWLYLPDVAEEIGTDETLRLRIFIWIVILYAIVRSWLAYKDPPWLNWEKVYPPIDVLIVSCLVFFSDRNPLGNMTLLYFFPIAEAAGTLNVMWAASIAVMSVFGTMMATLGVEHPQNLPFNVSFRFFFLLVMSSLLTALAKQAAELRARLRVAADRNRIALEMHDGVQGHLITAASQLELAQRLAEEDGARAGAIAGESKATIRFALDELRYLVQRMRAPELEQGFVPALKQYAHNICERNGLALTFEVQGEPRVLRPEVENALFRISQESLNNVLRHAQATAVSIQIEFTEKDVSLCLQDDGRGLPQDLLGDGQYHAGVEGMKHRAEELGGEFKLANREEKGAVVRVRVPLRITRRQAEPIGNPR